MVNIAAVFAQLERETTAERIRDNMRRLALTGRYIGSTPPLGFKAETIYYEDHAGNRKKMHRLAHVPEDMKFVELLFDKYPELGSLSKLEAWLVQNPPTGRLKIPGVSSLRRLLSNPVYVRADRQIYAYYSSLGATLADPEEAFDGISGMLIYGRHDREGGAYAPEKWTVVIAAHEGIISSEPWLFVQRMLEQNKTKAPRAGTGNKALLASKIRCGRCGAIMSVTYGGDKTRYYYKCRNKIHSRGRSCDISNISGIRVDEAVLSYLSKIPYDKGKAVFFLKASQRGIRFESHQDRAKLIREKEEAIKNMTAHLRRNENSSAAKYIISDIEQLDQELRELKRQELIRKKHMEYGEFSSFEERRLFINRLVDSIVWNEKELVIKFIGS